MDDQAPAANKDDDEGGGGWIMTFADLMSLLMCFFVLLLSFAEMDLNKFKAIAGSLKLAFGVQREVKAPDAPVGTSIIAQEFSPSRPQPTAINEVRQTTMDANKQTLEFTDALELDDNEGEGENGTREARNEQTENDAKTLIEALTEEIDKGLIQIETVGTKIIIRIREKASFPSGLATFREGFIPVVDKLRESLAGIDGRIIVAGHTDDVPIKTARFRSNWELSSSRAVSVVHELLEGGTLDPERFVVEGHGDAHPITTNDTAENRALNRRVEMTIEQGDDEEALPDAPVQAIGLPAADTVTGVDGDAAGPIRAAGNPSAATPVR